jgi:hypothetical protein
MPAPWKRWAMPAAVALVGIALVAKRRGRLPLALLTLILTGS